MASIFICSKILSLTDKDLVKLELPDMTMNMPVERLYDVIANTLNMRPAEFELVGYGRVLNPSKNLAYYGIRSSSVIYVYNKRNVEHLLIRKEADASVTEPLSQQDIHRIVVALRTALVNPEFKKVIERLSEREHQENLMSVTPGLREDPIALAILQDFELLTLCTEHENISKVLEQHPSLGTAATFLAAQFHEEHASADIFRRSPRSAYSLDDDVDDDDEDEGEVSYQSAPTSSTRAASNANLAQLLREALANANAGRVISDPGASTSRAGQRLTVPSSSQSQPANPVNSEPGSRSVNGADESSEPPTRITPEMLQLALNSARPAFTEAVPVLQLPPGNPSPATVGTSAEPVSSSAAPPAAQPPAMQQPLPHQQRDWSRELEQMRDMGISDDALCIQALEATNGDVQLAVNLIFNQ